MKLPKFKPHDVDYADMAFQIYGAQISQDYLDIIKTHIVPKLKGFDGMSLRELRVLMCLAFFEDALSPGQIAYAMRYDPSTVTRAIAILLKKDLIEYAPNIKDTRSRIVRLTSEGLIFGKGYIEDVRRFMTMLSKQLPEGSYTDDREEMRRLMLKVRERARALKTIADNLPITS